MVTAGQLRDALQPVVEGAVHNVRRIMFAATTVGFDVARLDRPLTSSGFEAKLVPVAVTAADTQAGFSIINSSGQEFVKSGVTPDYLPSFNASLGTEVDAATAAFPLLLRANAPVVLNSSVELPAGGAVRRALLPTFMQNRMWAAIDASNDTCSCFNDHLCSATVDGALFGLPPTLGSLNLSCSVLQTLMDSPVSFLSPGGAADQFGFPELTFLMANASSFATVGDGFQNACINDTGLMWEPDHRSFFEGCQPDECSYLVESSRPLGETIGLLAGFFGGFTTFCRLMATLALTAWNARHDKRKVAHFPTLPVVVHDKGTGGATPEVKHAPLPDNAA